MKIEIWSDVACPFCYIGQAHLDEALAGFAHKEQVEIEWKSFILDPTLPAQSDQDLYTSLSERKGMPLEQVMQMTAQVEAMAQRAGLSMNFDDAKPVATSDIHKLLQYAKSKGLGHEAKLRFFEAYFNEGANVADHNTLIALGKDLGLSETEVKSALANKDMQTAVERDIAESRALRVSGVPYFVIDRKYAMSGAQPVSQMRGAIEQAFAEWQQANPGLQTIGSTDGVTCKPEGNCD